MATDILTVQALTQYIKLKFDSDRYLKNIRMQAEIADINLRRGIYYLKLKDSAAIISAIIFSEYVTNDVRSLKQGDEIEVFGDVNVYTKTGSYQFYVREVELAGVGKFYRQFKQIQEKLYAKGYFDVKHKKSLPTYPKKIGLITASNSAALQDMLITLKNRYPLVEPIFFSATMQGAHALKNIVEQLKRADSLDLDIIILARGGGSYEDLVVFNEELIAQTIFDMHVPVITGIGHEIDTTIADLVADVRAATPTAAIEAAVPDKNELFKVLHILLNRYQYATSLNLKKITTQVNHLAERIQKISPSAMLQADFIALRYLQQRLISPQLYTQYFGKKTELLSQSEVKITEIVAKQLLEKRASLRQLEEKLEGMSPIKVLTRGYAYVEKADTVITNIEQVEINEQIKVHMVNGMLLCKIEEKESYGKK